MTYKKGIKSLKDFIKSEKDWAENPEINHGDHAVINQKNFNVLILEDILRDFESQELELKVSFKVPLATDLPHLALEQFQEEGIRLEGRGGILLASAESMQSEFVSFLVLTSISILSGSITIADFIYKKLQNSKNAKARIANREFDLNSKLEEIQKMVFEELEKVKEEDFEK